MFCFIAMYRIMLADNWFRLNSKKKTEKFVVVLNEVLNGGQKKAKEIQNFVLNHFQDVEIIGK